VKRRKKKNPQDKKNPTTKGRKDNRYRYKRKEDKPKGKVEEEAYPETRYLIPKNKQNPDPRLIDNP
jgi:hypothetical protein